MTLSSQTHGFLEESDTAANSNKGKGGLRAADDGRGNAGGEKRRGSHEMIKRRRKRRNEWISDECGKEEQRNLM